MSQNMQALEQKSLKICVLGAPKAGKTQICNKYTEKKFDKSYNQTKSTEISSKNFKSNNKNIYYNLSVHDIGDQNAVNVTKTADVNIFVFDLSDTNKESFTKDLKASLTEISNINIPVILVGSKSDLVTADLKSRVEKVESLIKNAPELNRIQGFFATTTNPEATENHNVHLIFNAAIEAAEKAEKTKKIGNSIQLLRDYIKQRGAEKEPEYKGIFGWGSIWFSKKFECNYSKTQKINSAKIFEKYLQAQLSSENSSQVIDITKELKELFDVKTKTPEEIILILKQSTLGQTTQQIFNQKDFDFEQDFKNFLNKMISKNTDLNSTPTLQ